MGARETPHMWKGGRGLPRRSWTAPMLNVAVRSTVLLVGCIAYAHALEITRTSTRLQLPDSVPAGGYGGLGYGKGYKRDADSPVAAVEALIGRLGLQASDFALSTIPAQADGLATMQLGSADGKVQIKGSNGVALASALNWYLNEFCNTTFDWNTYHVTVPQALPQPPTTEVRARTVKWGYYMNVCTMGYSLVFTDWNYWEKQIVSRTKCATVRL